MGVKATNRRKNNPKPDLKVNGEFKNEEPKRKIVRKGKYGLEELKKRLR